MADTSSLSELRRTLGGGIDSAAPNRYAITLRVPHLQSLRSFRRSEALRPTRPDACGPDHRILIPASLRG